MLSDEFNFSKGIPTMLKAYHEKLTSMSVVGQEHLALSRVKIKEKLNDAQVGVQKAQSRDEATKWARKAKRNAAKLRARNIVSPLTASMDYVLGAGRLDRKKPTHFGDSGVLPCVAYAGLVAATVGMSAVGAVGGYVVGLAAARPGQGAIAGAKVGSGGASLVLGTAAWALSQAAAVPGMVVKAGANGVGLAAAKLTPLRIDSKHALH